MIAANPSIVVTGPALRLADAHLAGLFGFVVEKHGAGAADFDAAAELGPGQAEVVAQDPEQRCIGIDVDLMDNAIDVQGDHSGSPELVPQRPLTPGI